MANCSICNQVVEIGSSNGESGIVCDYCRTRITGGKPMENNNELDPNRITIIDGRVTGLGGISRDDANAKIDLENGAALSKVLNSDFVKRAIVKKLHEEGLLPPLEQDRADHSYSDVDDNGDDDNDDSDWGNDSDDGEDDDDYEEENDEDDRDKASIIFR